MFKTALVTAAAGIVMGAYGVHIDSELSNGVFAENEMLLAQTGSEQARWNYQQNKREQELLKQRMANRQRQRGRYRRNLTIEERIQMRD